MYFSGLNDESELRSLEKAALYFEKWLRICGQGREARCSRHFIA